MTEAGDSPALVQEVADFYESKTRAVLRRYGPGPRVHYRTGLVDEMRPWRSTADLRRLVVESQERVLTYAAERWNLKNIPFRDVLDAGCGLGGAAIFWAQEFGARVTAATVAPTHVKLISQFAEQAGVSALVRPLLCDASQVPGETCFDAAFALDSSDTFSRAGWFQRLAGLMRPHGRVFVYDCFLENPAYAAPIDHHWRSQIGTLEDYVRAARANGFRLTEFDDVSHRAREFWSLTIALAQAELREEQLSGWERARLAESLEVHALMRRGLYDGGLRYALAAFMKE